VPKIVRDIVQGAVYVAILLAALRAAGVEPGSILTTSALLTAAIALSLQETLGNMVAGLAIQAQRPFDVGDWIQFDTDPKHVGRVLEINWRATKILSLDEVEVVIPNATLAKAAITNFTKPKSYSRRSIYVQLPNDVAPHLVHDAILKAIPGASGVLDEPGPSVVTNAFVDGNIDYWVRFYTDQFDRRDGVDGGVRDRIWHALSRLHLPLAVPTRDVRQHVISARSLEREREAKIAQREAALGSVDFLRVLEPAPLRSLAARSGARSYAAGELIVRQGEPGEEMFLIEAGEVKVTLDRAEGEVEVTRLGPGHFFGEMSLAVGERRAATVSAVTGCSLVVVGHEAFREALASAEAAAEHVSQVIAARRDELEQRGEEARVEDPAAVKERSSQLLGKIRKFFAL
jgi:CRP-like cAMP-binding protein